MPVLDHGIDGFVATRRRTTTLTANALSAVDIRSPLPQRSAYFGPELHRRHPGIVVEVNTDTRALSLSRP